MSTVNQAVPSQPSFMTKLVFTFPYEVSDIGISPCWKMLFKEIKIDGEQIVCNNRWCHTPSIQRLEDEWRRCSDEASKLWDEKLRLQRRLRTAILGRKKIEEKINELNRLYEERRKDCDTLFKELSERANKLQSELRRAFHEKLFEITVKPYLTVTSTTDEEINKVRNIWLDAVEIASRMCTPMTVPIPKGVCKVSMVTNIYGVAPHMFTIKKYIVEIYTPYDYSEFGAFINAVMHQYRDLITAGCFTISSDVIESETSKATNDSSTS